jgi:hypothetical protein
MRVLSSILLLLAAFTSICTANFDVYRAYDYFGGGADAGWLIFEADPSCNQVNNARFYYDRDDVSGGKWGVRCKGACGWNDSEGNIDLLEMNFRTNPTYHWSRCLSYLKCAQ